MADWFIATEGVKVVKDSASLWPQIITAVSSIGAALCGVGLTHYFTRRREERKVAEEANKERQYLVTELVFLLERYSIAWVALKWCRIHELHSNKKIPSLDLSLVSSGWRTLPPHLIFRLRSLETYQAELFLRIEQGKFNDYPPVSVSLTLVCLNAGIRAFILAAKLRRYAELPESVHLVGKQELFSTLRDLRQKYWHRVVLERKKVRENYQLLMENDEGACRGQWS